MNAVRHVLRRRAALARHFDIRHEFARVEESCVPSYLHRNPLAAGVAWWRLFAAVRLFRRLGSPGPVLDFGAATGELGQLLGSGGAYEFVEADDAMAQALASMAPAAVRRRLETLPPGHYGTVFALDSLEHNKDVPALVDALIACLRPGGLLIVSGPTENNLYRLGRRIAGFHGHYHHTNIHDIERVIAARLVNLARRTVPAGLPLFSVTAWGERQGGPLPS